MSCIHRAILQASALFAAKSAVNKSPYWHFLDNKSLKITFKSPVAMTVFVILNDKKNQIKKNGARP
jgi:hypothetical protein